MKTTKRHPADEAHEFPTDYRNADGVYVPKAAGEHFGYSDGDAQEDYLLQTIKTATDRSLFSHEIKNGR
jgi:hypothetical protein